MCNINIPSPVQSNSAIKKVQELCLKFPQLKKRISDIEDEIVVNEIAFAGAGSFNRKGKFFSYPVKGYYRHKLAYSVKGLIDIDSVYKLDGVRLQKFNYCFDKID